MIYDILLWIYLSASSWNALANPAAFVEFLLDAAAFSLLAWGLWALLMAYFAVGVFCVTLMSLGERGVRPDNASAGLLLLIFFAWPCTLCILHAYSK